MHYCRVRVKVPAANFETRVRITVYNRRAVRASERLMVTVERVVLTASGSVHANASPEKLSDKLDGTVTMGVSTRSPYYLPPNPPLKTSC